MYAHKPCPARCAKCKATAKASLNRLICQSGVNCERATAVNLLCGWCLWCHTDHVKYRLLFWFVLHVQESVKEIIRAGKTCITLKQMKAQRMLWEVKSLSGNQKKNKKCKCNNGVVDNSAVIDVFFSSSQGQKTWGAEVFLPLVCEWVGGVLRGDESRIEVNTCEFCLSSYTYVVGRRESSLTQWTIWFVHKLEMYGLRSVLLKPWKVCCCYSVTEERLAAC